MADLDLIEVNLEGLTMYSYRDLQNATRNFCDERIEQGGCKIEEGTYSIIYRATFGEVTLAVKRLRNSVQKQFLAELDILRRYKHENLLALLGCSLNGPRCCLVYDYMINGSIQERLACVRKSKPIPWMTRLSIAYGSAQGINHLHTYGEKPMVHRDIKSANILLDENFVPKICDFDLVLIGSNSSSKTMVVTQNPCGTEVYMAKEAHSGDVSVKLDTFSFGVVLLELLTGLPPFHTNTDRDLINYKENLDSSILSMLNPETAWNSTAAIELDRIAKLCLTESKEARPEISEILGDLRKCLSYVNEER